MKRFMALVVALTLIGSSTASAGELREVSPRALGVKTDGERFATYVNGPRSVILDTRTGRRRTAETDCAVMEMRAGRALMRCADNDALLDLVSGKSILLPGKLDVDGRKVTVRWYRLGVRWVQGGARCGRPFCSLYLDVVRRTWRRAPNTVVDLDVPNLRRHYGCDAQRRLDRQLAKLPWPPLERYDDGLLLVPRTGYWRDAPGLYVRGCPRRIVLSRAPVADPVLGGHLVSWHTGEDIDALTDNVRDLSGSLWLAQARSGRRVRWTLPRTTFTNCEGTRGRASVGRAAHTRFMVFWTATVSASGRGCDPTGGRVFSARIPQSMRR